MKTFYQAIELILSKGKRMRRMNWDGYYKSIFYINTDILHTRYIMRETDTIYETYIPSADDIIANDWIEV